MNPALRDSAAHVFVDSLAAPQLDSADEHHLRRVLRIRATDVITVSDGAGAWVTARLDTDGLRLDPPETHREPERGPHREPGHNAVTEPRPARSVVLTAIPKGDRLEWMVQKLTELGVTAIGLVDCARSVVRWDNDRAERQLVRLRKIAREAAMQSRRVWLPEIDHLGPFAARLSRLGPGLALAEPDGTPRLAPGIDTIAVGPEGGFTVEELAATRSRIALGPNVLRTETAAVAAAVVLTFGRQAGIDAP